MCGDLFALLLRETINDPTFTVVINGDDANKILQYILRLRADLISQISAIERLGQDPTASNLQVGHHVLLDLMVRCGRQGNKRNVLEVFA
jgi:hypothetical protein